MKRTSLKPSRRAAATWLAACGLLASALVGWCVPTAHLEVTDETGQFVGPEAIVPGARVHYRLEVTVDDEEPRVVSGAVTLKEPTGVTPGGPDDGFRIRVSLCKGTDDVTHMESNLIPFYRPELEEDLSDDIMSLLDEEVAEDEDLDISQLIQDEWGEMEGLEGEDMTAEDLLALMSFDDDSYVTDDDLEGMMTDEKKGFRDLPSADATRPSIPKPKPKPKPKTTPPAVKKHTGKKPKEEPISGEGSVWVGKLPRSYSSQYNKPGWKILADEIKLTVKADDNSATMTLRFKALKKERKPYADNIQTLGGIFRGRYDDRRKQWSGMGKSKAFIQMPDYVHKSFKGELGVSNRDKPEPWIFNWSGENKWYAKQVSRNQVRGMIYRNPSSDASKDVEFTLRRVK